MKCKLTFLTNIDNCVKQYNIPPELVLNADQTPSSCLCGKNDNGSAKLTVGTNQGIN